MRQKGLAVWGLRSAPIGARGFRDDPEKLKLQLASTHHLHPADPGLQAGGRMSGQLARARAPASDVVFTPQRKPVGLLTAPAA